MTTDTAVYSSDLAGIIVGDTAISDVQGEVGLLSYRGIDINELVGVPFLHVVWMVLFGDWPEEQEKSRLKTFMCRHSRLSHAEIELL
ncbi:MAG: citrate/2-methylcitrate synthase, partial [Halioglobus sp.]